MNFFLMLLAVIALLAGFRLLVRYVRHDGFAPPLPSRARLDTALYHR